MTNPDIFSSPVSKRTTTNSPSESQDSGHLSPPAASQQDDSCVSSSAPEWSESGSSNPATNGRSAPAGSITSHLPSMDATPSGSESEESESDGSSYYSCPSLPDTDPVRRVPAQHARDTVAHARKIVSNPRDRKQKFPKYPHEYRGVEELGAKVPPPVMEFPIMGANMPYFAGGKPGPARVAYNHTDIESPGTVMFHDPEKGDDDSQNMSLAIYHSAQKRSQANREAK